MRDKNPSKNIEPLCAGIKNMGCFVVGLAKSEQTEKSDKYDYEILWGQRRHLAFRWNEKNACFSTGRGLN